MKKSRLLACILAGTMSLTLAACGSGSSAGTSGSSASGTSGSSDGEKVTYNTLYSGEVQTLNYLTTSTTNDYAVSANIIDCLVDYDSYGNITPGLAESWESNDDMTQLMNATTSTCTAPEPSSRARRNITITQPT